LLTKQDNITTLSITDENGPQTVEILDGAQGSVPEIDLSGYATKGDIPTKISELENDEGYLTSYNETDPTVPSWAK
jgi:hypothetical protein